MKGVDILLIHGVSRHVQHTAGTRTARGGRRGALRCHDYSRFHFLLALPNLHNPSIIVSELFLVGQSPELMSSSTVQGSSFRRPKLRSCFSRFSIRGRFAPLVKPNRTKTNLPTYAKIHLTCQPPACPGAGRYWCAGTVLYTVLALT